MCLLYESCIWIAWFMQRKAARAAIDLTSGVIRRRLTIVFFRAFAFVLGAVVGSFLNVCIYRLPLDLSVNRTAALLLSRRARSTLPWYQNIPLLSWLLLRGTCANCGSRIAFRYFAVELLTALLFLAVWHCFPWPMAIVYWVFVSLLIVATFIDFEHFIIPDEITIGGTVAGVLASFIAPGADGQTDRGRARLASSLAPPRLVTCLLWIVLEGGQESFREKEESGSMRRRRSAGRAKATTRDFVVGEEQRTLERSFRARKRPAHPALRRSGDRRPDFRRGDSSSSITTGSASATKKFALDTLDRISGVVRELQIPREAMGRGDLKFLAAIGAFLGWRAVLFSVFAGSLLGSLVGLGDLALGKRVWSAKLPFGPYLALGALIWMFFGDALVDLVSRLAQSSLTTQRRCAIAHANRQVLAQ